MHGKTPKLAAGFALAALFLALPARAQQQDSQQSGASDAIAEAARKAKEEKKDQPKPKKVYTDDDISTNKGDVSVVGKAPAPADATAAPDGHNDRKGRTDARAKVAQTVRRTARQNRASRKRTRHSPARREQSGTSVLLRPHESHERAVHARRAQSKGRQD